MVGKAKKNKKKNQAKYNELEKQLEKLDFPECRVILEQMNADSKYLIFSLFHTIIIMNRCNS